MNEETTTNPETTATARISGTLRGFWPQLTDDQKTELRTAAPQLVAASRGASVAAASFAKLPHVPGFWAGAAMSACASLAAAASGLALLGATAAWLACGDGETAPNRKGE